MTDPKCLMCGDTGSRYASDGVYLPCFCTGWPEERMREPDLSFDLLRELEIRPEQVGYFLRAPLAFGFPWTQETPGGPCDKRERNEAARLWLRGGRRELWLEPGVIDALLSAPVAPSCPPVRDAVLVRWGQHPRVRWRVDSEPGGLGQYEEGVLLLPPDPDSEGCAWSTGPVGLMVSIARLDEVWLPDEPSRLRLEPHGFPIVHPDSETHDGHAYNTRPGPLERLVWALLAALADVRVSCVVEFPREHPTARAARKRGATCRRLTLTDDAQGVWATRKIGPPPNPVRREGPVTVATHLCREHTARYWVADPRGFDVEHGPDGEPMVRPSPGKNPRPLVAVRRPVREHVRGKGEMRANVTRVTT